MRKRRQKGEDDQDKYEWVGERFHLNPTALSYNPLFTALIVEEAVKNGELEDWEIEALDRGELPELPWYRELRESLEEGTDEK